MSGTGQRAWSRRPRSGSDADQMVCKWRPQPAARSRRFPGASGRLARFGVPQFPYCRRQMVNSGGAHSTGSCGGRGRNRIDWGPAIRVRTMAPAVNLLTGAVLFCSEQLLAGSCTPGARSSHGIAVRPLPRTACHYGKIYNLLAPGPGGTLSRRHLLFATPAPVTCNLVPGRPEAPTLRDRPPSARMTCDL